MHSPRVSVILPVYKEPDYYIQKAIESILWQTFRDFELLIIIDTGENDSEFSRVYRCVSQYSNDSRVRIIVNKENLKLPRTLNRGIEEARGDFIAIMNADDISLPERLETQLEFMESNKDIDLCGSRIVYIGSEGQVLGVSKELSYTDIIKRLYVGISPIPHPTWFVRKSFFVDLKGYKDLQGVEDYEILCRAFLRGKKLALINKPLLEYRIHINTNKITASSRNRMSCFTIYVAKKFQNFGEVSEAELISKCISRKYFTLFSILEKISLILDDFVQRKYKGFYNYLKWFIYMLSPYKARHLIFSVVSLFKFRFDKRFKTNLKLNSR